MRFISYNYHVCKGVRKNLMKLEVKELRKSFGDKEVLHGISFSIESGKALGLLGRNGAGKTTTIRILMDVFRANSGSITVDGRPFHPRNFRIGYLPEEVQIMVAEGLDIPLSEVYGVASFYAQFSMNPKGKYQISVCLGTACYVKGAASILSAVEQKLGISPGAITADGKFSLDSCRCVGACGLAPVMMVNNDVYGRLTPDQVGPILDMYK